MLKYIYYSYSSHIKSIYRNNNLIKDQIVHEYLRMVVQPMSVVLYGKVLLMEYQ